MAGICIKPSAEVFNGGANREAYPTTSTSRLRHYRLSRWQPLEIQRQAQPGTKAFKEIVKIN